jgi:hypothetical protein
VSDAERRAKRAAQKRERYRRRGEEGRAYIRAKAERVRKVRKPMVNSIKIESGCVDCGFNSHPEALQFDHIDPSTKLFAIAKGLTRSWAAILAEIEKCEVRCANCHAIRSMQEGHLGRPRV